MTSLGETLRRERTKRNLELDQISKDLKISCRMLAAIEDEKFDRLPGGVFSRSFVRQYARYLGLDEHEISAQLDQLLEPPPPAFGQPAGVEEPVPEKQIFPIAVPRMESWESIGPDRSMWRSPLTSLGLVIVAILGCAGVYAWWQRTPHIGGTVHEAAVTPAPPVPAPQPAPVETKPESAAQIQPASQTADASAPVRVDMTAAEPVWIEIKQDGRVTFAGTLAANERRSVDANTTVTLILGNAGGVNISLNGKPIGTVGGKGQVRNLQLTSGGFEIVPPKPAASLDEMEEDR